MQSLKIQGLHLKVKNIKIYLGKLKVIVQTNDLCLNFLEI